MPLNDGTNAEKEDVSPPLNWQGKEDIKDVVLHQMHGSPPCVKIRLLLEYYKVPYTTAGKKKGTDYKKVPVMMANGRQINDSYIIYKNLVPVLTKQPFDEEWQNKITYQLQPAIEAEAFGDKEFNGDFYKMATKLFGVPKCVACCIAGPMGRKLATSIRSKNPEMPKSTDVGKEFAAKIGSNKFAGGDEPNALDLAYYGTLVAFKYCETLAADSHLEQAGLRDWWSRMATEMPDVLTKK